MIINIVHATSEVVVNSDPVTANVVKMPIDKFIMFRDFYKTFVSPLSEEVSKVEIQLFMRDRRIIPGEIFNDSSDMPLFVYNDNIISNTYFVTNLRKIFPNKNIFDFCDYVQQTFAGDPEKIKNIMQGFIDGILTYEDRIADLILPPGEDKLTPEQFFANYKYIYDYNSISSILDLGLRRVRVAQNFASIIYAYLSKISPENYSFSIPESSAHFLSEVYMNFVRDNFSYFELNDSDKINKNKNAGYFYTANIEQYPNVPSPEDLIVRRHNNIVKKAIEYYVSGKFPGLFYDYTESSFKGLLSHPPATFEQDGGISFYGVYSANLLRESFREIHLRAQITQIQQKAEQYSQISVVNARTKEYNQDVENSNFDYISNSPQILFVTEYIIDGEFYGFLVCWKKYGSSTHYEVMKRNPLSDVNSDFQRMLFLDKKSLEDETALFIPYINTYCNIQNINTDNVCIILDDFVKKDRIYEYKIKASKFPSSLDDIDYDMLLQSKGYLEAPYTGYSTPLSYNIYDFAYEQYGRANRSWLIGLCSEKIPWAGRQSLEQSYSANDIYYPINTKVERADTRASGRDFVAFEFLARAFAEANSVFSPKDHLTKILNTLGGFDPVIIEAASIAVSNSTNDNTSNVFSFNVFYETLRQKNELMFEALESAWEFYGYIKNTLPQYRNTSNITPEQARFLSEQAILYLSSLLHPQYIEFDQIFGANYFNTQTEERIIRISVDYLLIKQENVSYSLTSNAVFSLTRYTRTLNILNMYQIFIQKMADKNHMVTKNGERMPFSEAFFAISREAFEKTADYDTRSSSENSQEIEDFLNEDSEA